jgi:LmeA-like phospholipid-binding
MNSDSNPVFSPKRSRLISTMLSPAIRLWLRSQVEFVEHLEFQIAGGDRQILSGYIQGITVAATQVVYQGIHLKQIALNAQEIRVNLGQVLKGKPLQLLAVVPVEGEACLSEADLNASLQAPLLAQALRDLLLPLLRASIVDAQTGQWGDRLTNFQDLQASIQGDRLLLMGQLLTDAYPASGEPIPFAISTGLQILEGRRLRFAHPQWLPHSDNSESQLLARYIPTLAAFDQFEADLGAEVNLRELAIVDGKIFCQGRVNVVPA